MLLAEITFSTEGITIIGVLLSALTGAIVYMFKLIQDNNRAELVSLRETFGRQVVALEADRNSWKEMTLELGINIEKAVNRKRASEGRLPFKVIEPVVPEHSSPVTVAQQSTADISTMRARLVAATQELGLPPRQTAEPATKEAEHAQKEAASVHENVKLDLKNSVAVDAIQDVVGAIDVAKLAADQAATVVGVEKKPEEKK